MPRATRRAADLTSRAQPGAFHRHGGRISRGFVPTTLHNWPGHPVSRTPFPAILPGNAMKTSYALILALAVPVSLAAQQPSGSPPANPITTVFRTRILGLHRNIAQAFDSIPEAKFSYKPTPAQLTIGFIAQHLVNDNYSLLQHFRCDESDTVGSGYDDGRLRQGPVAEGHADREAQGVVLLLRKRLRTARRCEAGRSGDNDVPRPIEERDARGYGAWPCDRPGGSLQPARELHAPEQHPPAYRAPASAPLTATPATPSTMPANSR